MTAPGSDVLDSASRAGSLARLVATSPETPIDVLIIGGGVVGCGSALDAAARGLSVGLVETNDLASGTSSRSSRLAHGGLRYLEQMEFGLVHEALTERGLLLDRLAPHLVRPVQFLYPVTRKGWERPYVGFGITVYDLLSRIGAYGGAIRRPKSLSSAEIKGIAPGLADDALVGAVRFNDAQIDDARYVLALARTAASYGANIATRVSVVSLLFSETSEPDNNDDSEVEGRRVVGALVRNEFTGQEHKVYAHSVIGATGVWTDELLAMAGADEVATVRQSKGVHLVVPKSAFPSSSALIARTPKSVLFLLPWGEHWLIGTTDTDYELQKSEPQIDQADVDYLLEQANRWLAKPLTEDDIVGIYSGLRPLLSAGAKKGTTTLSREHAVLRPTPGMVVIAGGKFTTYRVMAKDAVDAAVEARAEVIDDEVASSSTEDLPLVGAAGYREAWNNRDRIARQSGLSETTIEHLLRRHGDRVTTVLDLIAVHPELAQPLHPEAPYLMAEAVLAVTREGALSLADVLVRRTRVALESRDGAVSVARTVAEVLAPYCQWDANQIDAQVAEVDARREALQPVPGGTFDQQNVIPMDLVGDSTEDADLELLESPDLT